MSSYTSEHRQKNPFAPIKEDEEMGSVYPEKYAYYQHNSAYPRLETPPPSSLGSYSTIYPPPPSAHDERLGLIRGYHHELYDQNTFQSKDNCCSCSNNTKHNNPFICRDCNWGVAIGCVLLILGVLSILMGFLVPDSALQDTDERTGQVTLNEELSFFIDVFVIFGLCILSVGGLLISLSLLLPLWRRAKGYDNNTGRFYHASEWYVKEQEKVPHNDYPNSEQFLQAYESHEEIPGDLSLRKIQPESVNNEPVEMINNRAG